jgi:hypothetical protein
VIRLQRLGGRSEWTRSKPLEEAFDSGKRVDSSINGGTISVGPALNSISE